MNESQGNFKKIVGFLGGVALAAGGAAVAEKNANKAVSDFDLSIGKSKVTFSCEYNEKLGLREVEGNFDPGKGVDRIVGTDDQYVAVGEDGVGYLIGENGRIIFQNGKVHLLGKNFENGKLVDPDSWELVSSLPGGDGKTPPRASGKIGLFEGEVCK